MRDKKYKLPAFLEGTVTESKYKRWLHRKASAHVKADKKRFKKISTIAIYKDRIHSAVQRSNGLDEYTGTKLDWHLISTFNNKNVKRVGYMKKFDDLPTVDHVQTADGKGFKICSWAVNRMKSDMTEKQLIERCKKIIKHLASK